MKNVLTAKIWIVVGLAAIAAACSSSSDDTAKPLAGTTAPLPSELSTPATYVAKVKNILVGLPPTDDELKAVTADPTKLAGLIDGWMALPQYQDKMLRFFQLAFQQTQVGIADFVDQTFPKTFANNKVTTDGILQNMTESFARTVLALNASGHSLTEAMTTHQLMMTPALMEHYAFLDSWQVDDAGKVTDRFAQRHPTTSVVVTTATVSLADSVNPDPANPNFMHWTNAQLPKYDAQQPGGCFIDPVVFDDNQKGFSLQRIMQGALDGRKNPVAGQQACQNIGGDATTPVFTGDDYTTWKMVTIRAPKAGEDPTEFYDLPKLRTTNELVLQVPRVGFYSTPAFAANWQTNTSNQMRVTMNQTLIVGLGAAVDGSDMTAPPTTPGIDSIHAADPACVACHKTLDPTRSILASAFSWNYHDQTENAFAQQPGMFQFQNVITPVKNLDDFGNVLATHPLFGQAWAQKLCYYANSRACDADDPEFLRVVKVFSDSKFSWNVLVRELLSSPITTNAAMTATLSKDGEVIAVSRRDHLCAAFNDRLGLDDVCGLTSGAVKKGALATIGSIVAGLPSDGYGRGSIAPVLPNEPTLFYRAGTENICSSIAALVVDPAAKTAPATAKKWLGAQPDAAIADFVQIVMALAPSDPRSAPSVTALKAHFTAATQSGASPTDALRSTFVVACLAPSSISIGL